MPTDFYRQWAKPFTVDAARAAFATIAAIENLL
jgi:hypothetical protein